MGQLENWIRQFQALGRMGRTLDYWSDFQIKSELLKPLDEWGVPWANGAYLRLLEQTQKKKMFPKPEKPDKLNSAHVKKIKKIEKAPKSL